MKYSKLPWYSLSCAFFLIEVRAAFFLCHRALKPFRNGLEAFLAAKLSF